MHTCVGEVVVVTCFSDFQYVDPFWRHLQSKLEDAKIVRNFLDVFATQILLWLSFQKLYPNYHACIAARHVEKFSAVTPSSPKVIGIHNLNFKPTFKCLPLKFFEGAAFPSVNL